jgi:signal peptidase I
MKLIKIFMKEWFPTIITVIIISLIIRFFIIENVEIVGQSMEPTFQNGDWVVMDKISYRFTDPKIGDVVIVDLGNKKLIKRVVGTPGDHIYIKDGALYRNGEKVKEDYIKEPMDGEMTDYVVPQGDVYVMGDNRNNSADSRYYGPFEKSQLNGRIIFEIKNNFAKKIPH